MLPALLPAAELAADGWTLEEQSRITFTGFQQGQPVQGEFRAFDAEISFDPDRPDQSRVVVEIDLASVNTGHRDRDTTLRARSWFFVEQWPTARFESAILVHNGGDAYEAHGELTIRDVTQAVVVPFELSVGEDPDDGSRLLAQAVGELTISRLDYGVGQGEWAALNQVGEEVIIHIDLAASAPR
jgi:polyisoprenoid-binding protein YceI